ncbi:MAG: YceI family protein [Bacteroidota bacterium]|jgi:polyisoprenoid-binding protein YceI
MKKVLIFLFFVNLSITAATAQIWKPVTAGVSFKIKMLGATVDGKFKGFVGTLKFDPNDLVNSSLVASVDASTVDTDNNLRNKHLKEKEDFFDVAKYPVVKMKTTKIEKDGSNFMGYFDLTMKATTKNIKIPIVFKQDGNKATFQGSTLINRRDWSVGGGTFGMSDNVTFTIVINAIKE